MRRTAALLLLLIACSPASRRVPPASTPPPPPVRPENVVTVHGNVFDSAGLAVPHPRIRAWASDASCRESGEPVRVWGGASSSYEVTVERGVGPAERGCVVLEVSAGGSTARRTLPATFTTPAPRLEADVTLGPPPRLTRAEADRIIEIVRRGLTTRDPAAVEETALFLGTTPDAAAARLADAQRHLRTVTNVRMLREFVYELTGHRQPPLEVTITQDSVTRVRF